MVHRLTRLCVANYVLLNFGIASASISVLPSGVMNDVSMNTVINDWGWSVAYQGPYNASLPVTTMFANATGEYVMLAAYQVGSDVFDILAAATKTDALTYTPRNTTHTANGVEWYYNGGSMGFAGLGDTISQNSADTNGSTWSSSSLPVENDRLSWHTSGPFSYNGVPTFVHGGWRSGENINLNGSNQWYRVVLTGNLEIAAVPELSSVGTWAALCVTVGFGVVWQKRRMVWGGRS